MNNPSTRKAWSLALAVILAASLLSGCMSAKARLAASNAVHDLQDQLTKQDEAQQKAIEALIRQVLEQQRSALRQRLAAKKQELKIEIYERCETRLTALQKEANDQINQALDPVERRLKGEIDAETARGATGADKANTLRLQLATTLAFVQRDAGRNEMEIARHLLEERAKLVQQIDHEFKSPPASIESPVTDAELATMLQAYRDHQSKVTEGYKKATEALSSYVTAPEAWKLVLKGLLPEGLFAKLEPKLTEKLASTQAAVETWLETKSTALLKTVEGKVNSIKKKG